MVDESTNDSCELAEQGRKTGEDGDWKVEHAAVIDACRSMGTSIARRKRTRGVESPESARGVKGCGGSCSCINSIERWESKEKA